MNPAIIGAIFVIVLYLTASISIGLYSGRQNLNTSEDYFVANRSLGLTVMFFTLFATNISAFAYMGAPGGAYHLGTGFFGYLATTTSLSAIFFYLIGYRCWLLGKKYSFMTPAELFGKRYESKALSVVIFLVYIFFTVPYMAVQPIGAGYILSGLTKGTIPLWVGVLMIVVFVGVYVYIGGLRAVAWTDLFQGIVMIACVMLAFFLITSKIGGPVVVTQDVMSNYPELLTRQKFTIKSWINFGLMIMLCISVFPQMFTKFFAAKSSKALKLSASLYPLAMVVIYIPVLFIGVYGHTIFPNLQGKESDQIIPMVLGNYYALWIGAILLSAVFAAIMSSFSSQLITISTLFTKDIYIRYIDKKANNAKQIAIGRICTCVLVILTVIIALKPPATILAIVTWAFSGYALLAPAFLAGLYWKRSTSIGAIASILSGESVLLLCGIGIFPKSLMFGFDAFVPSLIVSIITLVLVSFCTRASEVEKKTATELHNYLDPIFTDNRIKNPKSRDESFSV